MRIFVGVVLLACCALGCGDSTSSEESETGNDWGEWPQSATLFGNGGDGICGVSDPDEDLEVRDCDWASEFDALVVVGIDDVEVVTSPSVLAMSGHQSELLDECTDGRLVEPTMRLDATILQIFRGDLAVGEELNIHFGGDPLRGWNPFPFRAFWEGQDLEQAYQDGDVELDEVDYEEVEWRLTEGYLEEGTHLGMGLYYFEEEDIWSPIRSQLFVFDDQDIIQFQAHGESCGSPRWEGATLEEFASGTAACSQSAEVLAQNELTKERALEQPRYYTAATCFPTEEESTP